MPLWMSFVNDNFQNEAIQIFNKLEISRERIDSKNESNLLIRFRDKGYDVSIEVVNDEMFHFCTCPHRSEAKACSHAGAIMLYKMMKDEKNDFNSKPKTLMKAQEADIMNQGGIGFLKEMFPNVKVGGKKNLIYFNFEGFDEAGQF